MSLGQILRDRRKELHLTLDEVADIVSFSKPYLSTIETGKVKNPPSDTLLKKLEKVLKFDKGVLLYVAHVERMPSDVRSDYEVKDAQNRKFKQIIKSIVDNKISTEEIDKILGDEDINIDSDQPLLKAGQLVPVINKVSAGYPTDFDDLDYPVGFADDYVRCPDMHDPNVFAVRVIGDSMESKFEEGDIVIFSPAAQVNSGDDCFVRFAEPHESTFKRVFFEDENNVRLQPRNDKYAPTIIEGQRINGMYRAVIKYQTL